jgi:hypothetical protein
MILNTRYGNGGSGENVPLTVTENGTYTAPAGKGYSPILVGVAPRSPWAMPNPVFDCVSFLTEVSWTSTVTEVQA